MAASYDLNPVDWISTGALGDPGDRTFYLQARKGTDYVALIVEKEHVAAIAEVAGAALAQGGATITAEDRDPERFGLEPIVPSWRVGGLAFGSDDAGDRFVLEARELGDPDQQGGLARFWMGRDELVELVARAEHAVTAGGRTVCPACGRAIAPGGGHTCSVDGNQSRFIV